MKHLVKLTATGLLFATSCVFALPDDRSKPIEIQANSAERDAKTGITTYTGNVDVQQGSIHISASVVVLNSSNNKLTKIHATGSPATYHQQLTGPKDVVDAQALHIYFDVAKDLITLQDNASLKQASGSIKGDRIEYDTKAERVKAQATRSGSNDNSQRITVIIPPATNDQNSTTHSNSKNKSE
ncbi:MAG TPA: lipopolysaccharide transport periplasmic protein LptA [Pseudomonadales bacterium]|jgi:lipopolysaccharide export system protein LptA|nr:lipopolysaccharide transport periplasmic protein LptA [Pseudomonadales bacterium]HNL92996.1 lipopolysaccharide transport periplasmic protein LptA [Pseudomonadales bacterium]